VGHDPRLLDPHGLVQQVDVAALERRTSPRLNWQEFWYGRLVGELLGYVRVSTGDQRLDLRLDALKAAGCQRVLSDTASGSLTERPELTQVFDHLRPGADLVVWRLDRLGRSVPHLIDILGELGRKLGVGLRSLQEGIDTTTHGGRLLFHVFSALAEFEREPISERSRAGVIGVSRSTLVQRLTGREARRGPDGACS
jgi:DNA invertase Pin-like site-specific DNA recombinase